MKKEITEKEIRDEYMRVYGKEPNANVIQLALAYNDMLNSREEDGTDGK